MTHPMLFNKRNSAVETSSQLEPLYIAVYSFGTIKFNCCTDIVKFEGKLQNVACITCVVVYELLARSLE